MEAQLDRKIPPLPVTGPVGGRRPEGRRPQETVTARGGVFVLIVLLLVALIATVLFSVSFGAIRGKPTLLRLAAGALMATAEKVLLEGQTLSTMSRRDRSCLVALVPQRLDVPFAFPVQQIVEHGSTPYLGFLRGPQYDDHLAIDSALDLTDTSRLRDRIFVQLSGGERRRVKLALDLAQETRLPLLDEPSQNFDIGRQDELIDLLHRLRTKGITILASMHDLHQIPDNFSSVHLLESDLSLLSGMAGEIPTSNNLATAFRYFFGSQSLAARRFSAQEYA